MERTPPAGRGDVVRSSGGGVANPLAGSALVRDPDLEMNFHHRHGSWTADVPIDLTNSDIQARLRDCLHRDLQGGSADLIRRNLSVQVRFEGEQRVISVDVFMRLYGEGVSHQGSGLFSLFAAGSAPADGGVVPWGASAESGAVFSGGSASFRAPPPSRPLSSDYDSARAIALRDGSQHVLLQNLEARVADLLTRNPVMSMPEVLAQMDSDKLAPVFTVDAAKASRKHTKRFAEDSNRTLALMTDGSSSSLEDVVHQHLTTVTAFARDLLFLIYAEAESHVYHGEDGAQVDTLQELGRDLEGGRSSDFSTGTEQQILACLRLLNFSRLDSQVQGIRNLIKFLSQLHKRLTDKREGEESTPSRTLCAKLLEHIRSAQLCQKALSDLADSRAGGRRVAGLLPVSETDKLLSDLAVENGVASQSEFEAYKRSLGVSTQHTATFDASELGLIAQAGRGGIQPTDLDALRRLVEAEEDSRMAVDRGGARRAVVREDVAAGGAGAAEGPGHVASRRAGDVVIERLAMQWGKVAKTGTTMEENTVRLRVAFRQMKDERRTAIMKKIAESDSAFFEDDAVAGEPRSGIERLVHILYQFSGLREEPTNPTRAQLLALCEQAGLTDALRDTDPSLFS